MNSSRVRPSEMLMGTIRTWLMLDQASSGASCLKLKKQNTFENKSVTLFIKQLKYLFLI